MILRHQIKLSLERKGHCPHRLDTQKLFHIYPRHVGRSGFFVFQFSFSKHSKSLIETIFVGPYEDVILDGVPAGPSLPV